MATRKRTPETVTLQAGQLGSHNMDNVLVFPYITKIGVEYVVTGVLREIHHHGEGVTVYVAGMESPGGDKEEFTIHPEIHVDVTA